MNSRAGTHVRDSLDLGYREIRGQHSSATTLPANCAEIGAREEESNRGYAARCAQLLGLLG
jgi:hypothetical protein